MATEKTEMKSNCRKGQSSLGERKLYPMTEEIYERGEKVFWERFEQLQKERHPDKLKEDVESE